MINKQTPARAGILGNPSDGFYGKTIAIPVRNFSAKIVLFEWDRIEILPEICDRAVYSSLEEMVDTMCLNGFYGGFRLIKAAIKRFYLCAQEQNIKLPDKKFMLKYSSDIPRQVGLAGSSGIITSTLKALFEFYEVPVEKEILANIVLWSETKELGISAGLQDRVVQVYDQPVYMDFDKDFMEEKGFGKYEVLDSDIFPPFYLAYRETLTHKSTVHNDMQARWERGEEEVHSTMQALAENTVEGLEALRKGDKKAFDKSIDKNFDLRANIYKIAPENQEMVDLARSIGATSKFPGSGGAVVGTFEDEEMFEALQKAFGELGCRVVEIEI